MADPTPEEIATIVAPSLTGLDAILLRDVVNNPGQIDRHGCDPMSTLRLQRGMCLDLMACKEFRFLYPSEIGLAVKSILEQERQP